MKLKLIILILISFSLELIAKTPDWVIKRPIDMNYYIGIGRADVQKGSSDHLEKAKNEALRNLASEITVQISGEIVSNLVEKSGLQQEELLSSIRSTTQAELEEFELVDTWQDKNQYWVYYRLSKSRYQQLHQMKVQKAMDLALNLYDQANQSLQAGQYDRALTYFLHALNPIEKYISEPLQIEYHGRIIYLNNEVYFSIQNLLSDITLTAQKPQIKAKRNQSVKEPLSITAHFNGSVPIANLPISFAFSKGEGELIRSSLTKANGIAVSRISRLKSNDKMQFISAVLDLSSLIAADSTSWIYQNIINTLPLPSARIILEVTGLVFLIESEEKNLGNLLTNSIVAPKLKEVLAARGFSFTDDLSVADLMIRIRANSRQGSEMFGMFSAFVDLNVDVTNMNSGEDVYADNISNINGQGLSFEKAGLDAFGKAADRFLESFLPALSQLTE